MESMKKAYQVGLYGDNTKVIDGTWRELFDDDGERPTERKSFEGGIRNGTASEEKIRDDPEDGDSSNGTVEEDESGANEKAGESNGGDKKGLKRKKGQKTLDVHFKKLKS
jgi:cryptochrome